MTRQNNLKKQVERQARRMRQAEADKPTLMAQTIYIGTLGLLFVLPTVGGAYLGHWLDSQLAGYSTRWTISLILVGVMVGAINVYLFLRE
ncbi:AtpZ/AtpI family protein [Marinobacter koreensis]|uniref:AtpZ/AtpI family protein n=1 Tax=Marinobacter koreensis TaxID=335974 RepID=A0ABW0RM20_9GAMM|nr:AtpZ/AtpI family protein [Marinobacter koreensis]MCK7549221.1 AtpZ/AtpI family protein [Marinobacter koreensis]MDX1817075.1 AtpZ/AtpI family protein [Marinobacter sp.]